MQLSLVAAFIPIVNIMWCGASAMDWDCHLNNIFSKCGHESSCFYNSLKTCYNDTTTPNESSLTDDIVSQLKNNTNTFTVLQTLHQEAKSERENITNVLTEVKTLLQVVKSELINVSNFQSEIKALRQEIKSEGDNSLSIVKDLLQEMKSEIKAIRQKKKPVEENYKPAVKSLLQEMVSEIKAMRQEMKSAEENSSSVVKSLLQELKPAEENSSSVVKTTAAPEGKELPKNCAELKGQGETSSGVQTVYPYGSLNPKPTTVYCDQETDGGGWTVIQSRSPLPIRENFTRSWTEYVKGFGDPKGEFWIGLDNIHALTNSTHMELRIDLEDDEGHKRWAHYATFHVGDAASEYVLRIGGYSGDAGDGMTYPSDKDYNLNNMKFSTHDNDNDLWSSGNCAEEHKGGWWFNQCSVAHLNGLPIVGKDPKLEGIRWYPFRRSRSLKKATMRIRPVSLGF